MPLAARAAVPRRPADRPDPAPERILYLHMTTMFAGYTTRRTVAFDRR